MKPNKRAHETIETKKASDVLREKLDDNRKKLQLIAREIVEKNQELSKLKLEIEEMGKMYNSSILSPAIEL